MDTHTLIFDLDDTLVECNKYFRASINKFIKQMQKWFSFLPKEEIKNIQYEIDLQSIEKYGLNSKRFPESLVSSYKFFCSKYGRKPNIRELNIIRQIGKSVFKINVQPFPHMYDVLDQLKNDGHQLYLFTGGDEKNQNRKISQLNLEQYFENRVFIYEHKNVDALREVLDKINTNKNNIWMIGNSLKTDIHPAVQLGINAIHIPSELEWTYNNISIDSFETFTNLNSLLDLPNLFKVGSRFDGLI